MQLSRITIILAFLLVVCLAQRERVDSAVGTVGTPRDQLLQRVRKQPLRTDYHVRFQSSPDLDTKPTNTSRQPIETSAAVSNVPPSPGIPIGVTWLDMQYPQSLGKQIARNPGGDYVHMVWSSIAAFDPGGHWDQLEVMYTAYRHSTGTLQPGFGGATITLNPIARGQFATVDVDDDGEANPVSSYREDVTWPRVPFAAYLPTPGSAFSIDIGLYPPGNCGEMLWPKHAVQQRTGSSDVRHVIARGGFGCDETRIYYWRYDGQDWSGPALIDSSFSIGHVIAADNNSDKVAIILHDIDEPGFNGANNVFYYESTTGGVGWSTGSELGPSFKNALTSYTDTVNGPQAWQQLDAVYDNAGRLHVVWDEQLIANKTTNAAIRHWNDQRNTIRPVMLAVYPNPFMKFRLNVSVLSIGIGDGSTTCAGNTNLDVVYVTYTKFGGTSAVEQADVAGPTGAQTHPNGEVYISSSNSGGNTWGSPRNLTNTKTPNCNPAFVDSVCRSEDWASLNKVVSDIDILYISDRDAGAATQSIGSYQPNDVMYLRIPGGGVDPQIVCPNINPGYHAEITEELECEYHADPGTVKNDELLYVLNLGNAPLIGTVSVLPGAPWLTIPGAGGYTIPAGGADLIYTLSMDATSLSEGLYKATIRVTHNDPDKPSPQDYQIDFFVLSDFKCPQGAVISTGVE